MTDIPQPAIGEIVTIHRAGCTDRHLEITVPGDWALLGMEPHTLGWTTLHGRLLDDPLGPLRTSLYVQWTGEAGGWQMMPALSVPMDVDR